jgi:hypothetical protein
MTASHQTIRLERGRHVSPDDGACVMELASMLAGERFTDSPRCVCPVIAAFLRRYNDVVDDRRRQDLYRHASLSVGSRGSRSVLRRRARRCSEFAGQLLGSSAGGFALWPSRAGNRAASALLLLSDFDKRHRLALDLADELLAIGGDGAPMSPDEHSGVGGVLSGQ